MTSKQVNNAVIEFGHRCTCGEYHAQENKKKKKDETPFWLSFAGLNLRIDTLSQDLMFPGVNIIFQMIAEHNRDTVTYLHWVTAEDDNVCTECIAASKGGRNRDGYYRPGELIPLIPVHPNCRCQIELVFMDEIH